MTRAIAPLSDALLSHLELALRSRHDALGASPRADRGSRGAVEGEA